MNVDKLLQFIDVMADRDDDEGVTLRITARQWRKFGQELRELRARAAMFLAAEEIYAALGLSVEEVNDEPK